MIGNGSIMSEWKLREQMCEIGRRVYAKGFAAANDGNISFRLGEDRVLCTPDPRLEGVHEARRPLHRRPGGQAGLGQAQALQRDPAAPVDPEGAARRPGVRPLPPAPCHGLRRRARADPQVHAARVRGLPRRGGDHPLRDPRHPGVCRHGPTLLKDTDTIILANHGTITAGSDLEDAYFKTEIIDAYCRILILAKQLGTVNYYSDAKAAELIKIKPGLGIRDVRLERGLENCDLCGNSLFREGYSDFKPEPKAFIPAKFQQQQPQLQPQPQDVSAAACSCPTQAQDGEDIEALVRSITDQVMLAMNGAANDKDNSMVKSGPYVSGVSGGV